MKYLNLPLLTPIQKILCIALSAEENEKRKTEFITLFEEVEKEKLFREAEIDEVISHLVYKMKKWDVTVNKREEALYQKIERRIIDLMNELERVASHLAQYNIQIVALKNAGITKGIFKVPSCSPMGDLDLLIATKDFRKAHFILLEELGYTFKFRSELEEEDLEEAIKGGGTEYYKIVDGNKVWLELQWRPVAGRWIQPHAEPKGDDLMKRSESIQNSNVRLLSPEDNLLQVALHTAKHSYCRAPGFRLHSDVDRVVRFTNIDWTKFLEKVESLKLKTAVYFSLVLAKKLLDTPIPENVIFALTPNQINGKLINRFLSKAGLFNQEQSKFSKLGYIFFNFSLYDTIGEMLTAIFPPRQIMKKRYQFEKNIWLPYYHLIRIFNLLLKRAKL